MSGWFFLFIPSWKWKLLTEGFMQQWMRDFVHIIFYTVLYGLMEDNRALKIYQQMCILLLFFFSIIVSHVTPNISHSTVLVKYLLEKAVWCHHADIPKQYLFGLLCDFYWFWTQLLATAQNKDTCIKTILSLETIIILETLWFNLLSVGAFLSEWGSVITERFVSFFPPVCLNCIILYIWRPWNVWNTHRPPSIFLELNGGLSSHQISGLVMFFATLWCFALCWLCTHYVQVWCLWRESGWDGFLPLPLCTHLYVCKSCWD